MEEQVKLACALRWPALRQAGTFQKTIGRSTEAPAVYVVPSFPVSLLRDANAFESYCKPHLVELSAQVQEPWEFWFDAECDSSITRQALPPMILPVTFGPYPAGRMASAYGEIRQCADLQWTQLQTYELASVQVFKAGIGMTSHALHDVYRFFWGTKDGSLPNLTSVDNRLRESYTELARSNLQKGDKDTAAEYAKIAFDLSPTQNVADDLWLEFAHLTPSWDGIAAAKENAVKRVATVAREGSAEWWNSVTDRYYRNGLITPMTRGMDGFYSSGELEARRQKRKNLSANNPYRRGLDLMEKIEASLGFWAAMHQGIFTEWPLEEVRRRVPSSIVKQVRKGSPWAPDVRLEKLFELSLAEAPSVPFAGGIMPHLHSVYTFLDDTLPGILTHALNQLPDN
jgi:hypothetical protein